MLLRTRYFNVLVPVFILAVVCASGLAQTPDNAAAAPPSAEANPEAPKPPELKPVPGFILRHNMGKDGLIQAGLMQEGKAWREADFAGQGVVTTDAGVLHLGKGDDMTGVTWDGPLCRMNYEITLDAMREEGEDFFCGLTFPVGEDPCSLILGGWGGSLVGLSSIDYNDAANNTTTRIIQFENNRWYRVRVRVYGEKIEAWLDDKKIVDVVTTGHQIGVRWEMEVCIPLGIATWRTTGAIRDMQMRVLTEQPLDYEVKE